jgi:hypothetical protein
MRANEALTDNIRIKKPKKSLRTAAIRFVTASLAPVDSSHSKHGHAAPVAKDLFFVGNWKWSWIFVLFGSGV